MSSKVQVGLSVEDILEMNLKGRDKTAAQWRGKVIEFKPPVGEQIPNRWKSRLGPNAIITWPKYSKHWNFCGCLLENLPPRFKAAPKTWLARMVPEDWKHSKIGLKIIENPLSRESIVVAAGICFVQNIAPERNQ
jgi:hypothetical protein